MTAQKTLLDTDLYKFTMGQAAFFTARDAQARYTFSCRDKSCDLSGVRGGFERAFEGFLDARISADELSWMDSTGLFKPQYLDFLSGFKPQRSWLDVSYSGVNGFEARVSGPWVGTVFFEVPLLAAVSEAYFEDKATEGAFERGRSRILEKAGRFEAMAADAAAREFVFGVAEFGTRRRFSRVWHEEALGLLAKGAPKALSGTSNMDLARRLGLKPIGTLAHEWFQAWQSLSGGFETSEKAALDAWESVYGFDSRISLTDTLTTESFLRSFSREKALSWKGLRHDSGDPMAWGERVLAMYEGFGIDARERTLVFSDGLNATKAEAIWEAFKGRARIVFGIGTDLTNDLGFKALNIVMKMDTLDGVPVAKVSDVEGKAFCLDPARLESMVQWSRSGMPTLVSARMGM